MVTKIFCDKCGTEIKGNDGVSTITKMGCSSWTDFVESFIASALAKIIKGFFYGIGFWIAFRLIDYVFWMVI